MRSIMSKYEPLWKWISGREDFYERGNGDF